MATFQAKLNPAKFMFNSLDFGSEFNQARWKEFAEKNTGKTVRIELPEPSRTNTQNNFYWLYLSVIERETGNNQNDLHEFFKRQFLPPQKITVTINGQEMERMIPASTTKLSKNDFGDYLDKICALTNVPIPDPQAAGFLPK